MHGSLADTRARNQDDAWMNLYLRFCKIRWAYCSIDALIAGLAILSAVREHLKDNPLCQNSQLSSRGFAIPTCVCVFGGRKKKRKP